MLVYQRVIINFKHVFFGRRLDKKTQQEMYECEMGLSKNEKCTPIHGALIRKPERQTTGCGCTLLGKATWPVGQRQIRYDTIISDGEASIDFQIATFARLFTG